MPDRRLLKHYNQLLYDNNKDWPNRKMENVSRRFTRVGEVIYKRLFELEVGKKVPNSFNQKHIAEMVFFTTMTELDKMVRRRDFYKANAELFLRYIPKVCEMSLAQPNFAEARLQSYLFESVDLLKLHSRYISKNGFDYSQWRTEYTPFYFLFRNSRRLINYEPVADANMGIATLRICIEGRIRGAVGVIGVYSPKRHEVYKISMSRLFSEMRAFRDEIEIECDIEIIQRIYSWSNHFIHASYANYEWLAPFAHDLLQPLFFYAKVNDEMNLHASIRMKPETLRAMRAEIMRPFLDEDDKAQIHGYREEDCQIGRL